jgi:ParB/RepB/Spo0J family partition protein
MSGLPEAGAADLVDEASAAPVESMTSAAAEKRVDTQSAAARVLPSLDEPGIDCRPLLVPTDCLDEDSGNPRTTFPDEELAELAQDIALRGILQPIVVRRAGGDGRYRVLFGAKRLRAAKRAALKQVPVVIGSEAHDVYAQVAENQKRHGLTPLDLARFMRSRFDAGESNAEIANRMGIDLTSVAHHLALLTLPPELDEALRSGRCTSPRTLYELAKLQKTKPERVKAIVSGGGEITRKAVASLTRAPRSSRAGGCAGVEVVAVRRKMYGRYANSSCITNLVTAVAPSSGRATRPLSGDRPAATSSRYGSDDGPARMWSCCSKAVSGIVISSAAGCPRVWLPRLCFPG